MDTMTGPYDTRDSLHICQTSHTSPNFNYDGDSMWYWEASASWYGFMGSYNISDVDLHTWGPVIEMGATIVANPQLALWHSFSNGVSSHLRLRVEQIRGFAEV